MSHLLLSCLSLDEGYRGVSMFAERLFPSAAGHLYLLHASRDQVDQVRVFAGAAHSDFLA